MKIKKINLTNVKGFKEKDINFKFSNNKADILVILGENGSGKSTILKSIVNHLTALCPIYRGQYFDHHDVYLDEEQLKISAEYVFNDEELQQLYNEDFILNPYLRELEYSLYISGNKELPGMTIAPKSQEEIENIIEIRKIFCSSNFIGGNVFYFDPYRFLPNDALEGPNTLKLPDSSREGSLTSSVLDNKSLNRRFLFIKQWFINLDFKRLKNPSEENEYIFEKVTKSFDELFYPYTFEKVSERGDILFKCNNKLIEIDRLSEGFKNIFILVGEILFRLSISYPNRKDFFNAESIILIDEIDCHLHPKWQVKILAYLKEIFSNSQIIVTTHSPFITTNINSDCILKLGDVNNE